MPVLPGPLTVVTTCDLIPWDAAAGGYRIDPADAEIILANWG